MIKLGKREHRLPYHWWREKEYPICEPGDLVTFVGLARGFTDGTVVHVTTEIVWCSVPALDDNVRKVSIWDIHRVRRGDETWERNGP